MNNPNMKKLTKLDFDLARLYLSERCDHEIEINDNTVEGVVYICICNEDDWIGLDFKAHINKVHSNIVTGKQIGRAHV